MDFFSLTDDEIKAGIDIMNETQCDVKRIIGNPVLYEFCHNSYYKYMARLWIECDGDRTLMRLKYHEEINRAREDEWTLRSKYIYPSKLKVFVDLNS